MALTLRELMDNTLAFLGQRKAAYQRILGKLNTPDGRLVFDDLAKFCRANETCVVLGNDKLTWVLEGRREVFLRITQHLNLTPDQLYALYNGQSYKPNTGGDDDA